MHRPVLTHRRWGGNLCIIQGLIVALIMFCSPGMNTTVVELGAGGSRAEMLPLVNKITATTVGLAAAALIFAGSFVNRLGPKLTLIVATSGYPSYVACLWLLDRGHAEWFAWVAAIWHGFSAALLYSATGYLMTSYSTVKTRGRYIALMWCSQWLGNIVGSGIVLGITMQDGKRAPGVPTSVYATIISIQCVSIALAFLIVDPGKTRQADGKTILTFKALTWLEELRVIRSCILQPQTLLLSVGLLSCQTPIALLGGLNSFFFSVRTRALVTTCYSALVAVGALSVGLLCDFNRLGDRKPRSVIIGAVAAVLTVAIWPTLLWFLHRNPTNRSGRGLRIDWVDGSRFDELFPILVSGGFVFGSYQIYLFWLCSTFTDDPFRLAYYNAYITTIRLTGSAAALGLDSHRIPFIKETEIYFVVAVVGICLALVSAAMYTSDTVYEAEPSMTGAEKSQVLPGVACRVVASKNRPVSVSEIAGAKKYTLG